MLVSSLTLPTSAFPSVHIVGSVTPKLPKLPSIIMYIHICIYIYAYVYIYILYVICNYMSIHTCTDIYTRDHTCIYVYT